MRLFEHEDFDQIVIGATQESGIEGLTEQLVEKDYYVTEVLRIVANSLPTQAIFKGGTSLSKAWGIIERFSEDVDLFVDPAKFDPALSKRGIDRELKKLRDEVNKHPALTLVPEESKTSGGAGRADLFRYRQRFSGITAVRDAVLLESGTASGREPVVEVRIESYVAAFLRNRGLDLGAEDQDSFTMRVMHFRRTFVEKLFAIHAKVEISKETGRPIGSYARHYYDLNQLLQQRKVLDMLDSPEFAEIKDDYRKVSLESFPKDYREPEGLSFADSDAIFPAGPLYDTIEAEYREQCQNLCYGPFPPFAEVAGSFLAVRDLL